MSSTPSNSPVELDEALKLAASQLTAGNPAGALNICQKLLLQFPNNPKVHYASAIALTHAGNSAQAVIAYQTAIRLDPNFFEAHFNFGTILSGLGRYDEAIAEFLAAARLRPRLAEVYVNLSNACRDDWRMDQAIAFAEKALAIKPSLAEAHLGLGAALACRGQFDRAIKLYREAIRLKPDFPTAHLNLALALLTLGNFEEGWPEYEWRRRCPGLLHRGPFSEPVWDGRDPAGKTILLYSDQGLGDSIHFVRYVPMVATLGAKVVLECEPPLARLFRDIPGVERLVPQGQPLGQFDLRCSLPSLPGVFKTALDSIPAKIPYLAADPESVRSWAAKISRSGNSPQIGLSWAGNAENRNDRNRSIPLEKFSPLSSIRRAQFHSLQIDPPPANAGIAITDWSGHLSDFSETAALIANLDLIVTVDTAVAHLAGAMGKKTWLLLPSPPDWRWMLDRADSPWYPTMRLFRQPSPGDWDAVICKVAAELQIPV